MAKTKKQTGTGFITDVDRYLFGNGTHYEIFDKLGAHPKTYNGKKGMYFAVWAPHAQAVSLVCDRNDWVPGADPMTMLETSGIWEVFIPKMGLGELYKFAITTSSGKVLFKADPYAFSSEYRPGTASVTADIELERQRLDGKAQGRRCTEISHEHLRSPSRLLEEKRPGRKRRILHIHRGRP